MVDENWVSCSGVIFIHFCFELAFGVNVKVLGNIVSFQMALFVMNNLKVRKTTRRGGLNCVFGIFFLNVLDNCPQVQSLSEFRVYV